MARQRNRVFVIPESFVGLEFNFHVNKYLSINRNKKKNFKKVFEK